jgi:hypothetical protein
MKTHPLQLAIACFAFLAANAPATVRYVDLNCTNPVSPYTNWATAAINIQNAVDGASDGDEILVTNGVYQTGGRLVLGDTTSNRLAITKAVTVQSVNGPSVTVIKGYQVPGITNGNSAVRCVYLANNAILIGFTLTNGATQSSSGSNMGGGVRSQSMSAVASNCVIVGNSAVLGAGSFSGTLNNCTLSNNVAQNAGGGAYNGTLNNCLVTGNSASYGGAVSAAMAAPATILNNCTIYGNSASVRGGGLHSAAMAAPSYLFASNCIVLGNTAPTGSNYLFGNATELTFNYCCTAPLPTTGIGNITNDPAFADPFNGNFHLQSNSPCINAGSSNAVGTTDLDGNPRLVGTFVDLGAYEYQLPAPVPVSPSIQATYTGVSTGIVVGFTGQITGHATVSRWDFGDGTVISNQLPSVSHSWASPGDYVTALWAYNDSYPNGVSAAVIIHVLGNPVYYVSQSSTNPVAPYLSWDTAATNIQDAVDAAYVGGTVLVSNGVYATSGEAAQDGNRVAVIKQIAVRSVNGPAVTTVDGGGAVRCFYLTNNATLAGFTLTNGASGGAGGGVYCASLNVVVSNCLIIGNTSGNYGGGTYSGTLENCFLVRNYAMAAGGASDAALNHCVLSNNVAQYQGGGAHQGTFNNCLLVGNSAPQGGAILVGSPNSTVLNNCTIYGNSASVEGGGIDSVWATANNSNLSAINCIIFGNISPNGSNYYFTPGYDYELSFNYCCITPLPTTGLGSIANDPAFADPLNGNFHLQSNSPCINSGNNAYVTGATDLDGNPRIKGGTVDIGAYEFQSPSSILSYAWLQQYGLTNNGSADYADADGDGFNNWNEWRAGTIPTDPSSLLKMTTVTNDVSGITVTWQSVSGVTYFLQRGTDLGAQPAFSTIQTDIAGQPGTTSYTDTDATGAGPYFYRVGVQQ